MYVRMYQSNSLPFLILGYQPGFLNNQLSDWKASCFGLTRRRMIMVAKQFLFLLFLMSFIVQRYLFVTTILYEMYTDNSVKQKYPSHYWLVQGD